MMLDSESVALRSDSERAVPRGAVVTALQFLFVAICTVTFVFPVLTACGILFGKNLVGARDYVEYWASGQQLIHRCDPYAADPLLMIERSGGLPEGVDVIVTPNPPTALLALLPLGFVSASHGSLLWTALLLGSFIASVQMVHARHGSPKNQLHWLGYSFAPALVCLARGQISVLILLGLVLFLRWHRTRPLWAGASLWLCALKPHLFLPFGVVLLAWVIATRSYRILAGGAGAIALSAGIVTVLDSAVWSQWARMMSIQRPDEVVIPCLSNMLRRAISPEGMWLQYVPAALACLWALSYFQRHKDDWDWWRHGSILVLVSMLVAPYTWMTDQTILIPALLHAVYVSRSRIVIAILGLASAAIQMSPFFVQEVTHAVAYSWTAPVWLALYLLATCAWPAERGQQPSPAA